MFVDDLKNTLNNEYNYSITENGALGYRTSGKALLDLNYAVSSLRSKSNDEIVDMFMKAFFEDKITALKWLFYLRDVREGLGERRSFRVIFNYLANNYPEYIVNLVEYVSEYGRWDDLWELINTNQKDILINIIRNQIIMDKENMANNKPISLIAKWLPSVNTSSKKTVNLAKEIYRSLNMTEREYRKTLSILRKYINVVEVQMSANKWNEINYEAVSSRANLIYNNAFLRHDEERRREFLESLKKGEAKINSGVLFPHDIVHKYTNTWACSLNKYDETLEQLWKSLPNLVNNNENTIVVADGSGSMLSCVDKSKVKAIEVANALAIYFAERSSGQFKDKYITFSNRPQLVDFSKCNSLREKLEVALMHNEVANTNIQKVFELILTTAINNKITQDQMPKNILIISDMEFDYATDDNVNNRLFETINQKYINAGYKLPRLVFWNVCSRTNTIPVKENDLGVALVSGFSTNIVKMVLSNSTDPYECLLEVLNSERYKPIELALSK